MTFHLVLIDGAVRLWGIRRYVAESMSAVGRDPELVARLGRRAVGRLIPKLKSESTPWPECLGAAKALGLIGGPRAICFLESMAARGTDEQRRAALVGLAVACQAGRAQDPERVFARIVDILENASAQVRRVATMVLGCIRDGRGLALLGKLRQDADPMVRRAAAAAIESLGETVPTDPRGVLAAFNCNSTVSSSTTPLHACLDSPDDAMRLLAVEMLVKLADASASDRLADCLDDQNPIVRQAAQAGLSRISRGVENRSRAPDI